MEYNTDDETEPLKPITESLAFLYFLLDSEEGTDALIAMIKHGDVNQKGIIALEAYLQRFEIEDESQSLELQAAIKRVKNFFTAADNN